MASEYDLLLEAPTSEYDALLEPEPSPYDALLEAVPFPEPEWEPATDEPKTLSDLMSGRHGQTVKIPKNIKVPTLGEVGVFPKEVVEGAIRYATLPGWTQLAAEAIDPTDPVTKIGKGLIEGGSEVVAGFTTPENLSQLAIMPTSKIAQIVMNLGFGAEAATHLPEQIKAYGATDDPQEKAKIAAGVIAGLGGPGFGVVHGIMRKAPVRPASDPEGTPATTEQPMATETPQGAEPVAEIGANQAVPDQMTADMARPVTQEPVRAPLEADPVAVPETPVGEPQPAPGPGISRIGQSIEAKAVEAKLTQGFEGTANYDRITVQEQAAMATGLVKSSLDQARAVIRGEAPLPDKLRGTSLITAMEEHILKHPNAELAHELANSPLVRATSEAAQEMRLMAERVPDGITAAFHAIREARKAGSQQRGQTVERVVESVKTEIVKNSSKRPTWEAFVNEIICHV